MEEPKNSSPAARQKAMRMQHEQRRMSSDKLLFVVNRPFSEPKHMLEKVEILTSLCQPLIIL